MIAGAAHHVRFSLRQFVRKSAQRLFLRCRLDVADRFAVHSVRADGTVPQDAFPYESLINSIAQEGQGDAVVSLIVHSVYSPSESFSMPRSLPPCTLAGSFSAP